VFSCITYTFGFFIRNSCNCCLVLSFCISFGRMFVVFPWLIFSQ
jgi:hypothetical protein